VPRKVRKDVLNPFNPTDPRWQKPKPAKTTTGTTVDRSGTPGTGSYRKKMNVLSSSIGAGSQSRARNRRKPK